MRISIASGKPPEVSFRISEEQRIAVGFRPRTLRGWWFWLRCWSPPALYCTRIRHDWFGRRRPRVG
jgi:hypothetical protein